MLKIGRKTLLLVLTAAILFTAWLLYVPYRPEHLLRAVPANAQILTAHDNLAARWPALMQNPLLQSLALAVGVDTPALKTFATDPAVHKWVTRLAARNTVLAYVPRLGAGGRPAWMLASWLGGDNQILRYQLAWFPPPGFERHAPHNGVPYWTVQVPGLKGGMQISLAFVEGLLIACIGEDNTAILDLLDTSDGLLPSLALARSAKLSDYWCLAPTAPDHGWVDTPSFVRPAPGKPAAPPLTVSVSLVQAKYIEGGLCGPVPLLPAAKTSAKALECGDLAKFTGNLPIAALTLRTETVLPPLSNLLGAEWSGLLDASLRLQGADRAAVFMFGGDHGGRLYGFRIPALVAAIPMRKPEAMLGLLQGQLLDRLSQQRGLGLVTREMKAGTRTYYLVESTTPGAFSDLPPDERPAYAVCDQWFLAASSARSLAALLTRYDTSTADNEARTARWPEGLSQARGGAYAWADMAKLRDELRLVIAGYSLKLMLEDPQKAAGKRQQLNLWKAWLEALAPLGEARFWLTSDGQLAALRFQAGQPER
jgi:hypothetical protein